MRVTGVLNQGFLGRTMSALRHKRAMVAINADPFKPLPPYPIIAFDSAEALASTKRMSDKDIGGYSEAHTDWVAPNNDPKLGHDKGYMRFHGNIDPTLPKDRPDVHRSGYAGWRTLQPGMSLFGRGYYDLDRYKYLAMRIKSDGRKYFVNIQADSQDPIDLHQHRLYARTPGEWETVLIKLNEFVLTQGGLVMEPQHPLPKSVIKSVGLSLIDRIPGPFDLAIESIWACEKSEDQDPEYLLGNRYEDPLLKKQGENNTWNLPRERNVHTDGERVVNPANERVVHNETESASESASERKWNLKK